jgi:hypothetical protein
MPDLKRVNPAETLEAYERVIGPLRERARELGYAIGVHGSLARDIDLIACPWTDRASSQAALAFNLQAVAERIWGQAFMNPHEDDDYFRAGCPNMKPHGRLTWSFHLGGANKAYIDLSVMPPLAEPWTWLEGWPSSTFRRTHV